MRRLTVFVALLLAVFLLCLPTLAQAEIAATEDIPAPEIFELHAMDLSDQGGGWALHISWEELAGVEEYALRIFVAGGMEPEEVSGRVAQKSRWKNAFIAEYGAGTYWGLDENQTIHIRIRAIDGNNKRYGAKSDVYKLTLPAFNSLPVDPATNEPTVWGLPSNSVPDDPETESTGGGL